MASNSLDNQPCTDISGNYACPPDLSENSPSDEEFNKMVHDISILKGVEDSRGSFDFEGKSFAKNYLSHNTDLKGDSDLFEDQQEGVYSKCSSDEDETALGHRVVNVDGSRVFQNDVEIDIAKDIKEVTEHNSYRKSVDDTNFCGTLENLPPEILLKICSYLHAKFVLLTLTRVNRMFWNLLSDEATWKIRVAKRCPKRYPVIAVEDFNWKMACVEREEQYHLWSNHDVRMDHFELRDGISAPVDVVHLMHHGTLLASGSRDKYLNLWDLNKLDPDQPSSLEEARIVSKMNAHMGWIWSITSQNHMLATASWDTFIKFWDLGAGCREVKSVKCKSAILTAKYSKDVLIAGAYDKFVYAVDTRMANIINRIRHHRRPVLSVEVDDDFIISASEDQTVCVYDRRACCLLKTLRFDHFPMCLSYKMNQLLIGDKKGFLHVVDASDFKFDVVKTYETSHQGKLTGVIYNYGSIITSSTDKTVRIMEPCLNPETICTLKTHQAEVARIDWQNDVLATAGSDISVGIWRPKCHSRSCEEDG